MSCHGCLMSVRKLEGTEPYSDYADKCPTISCNLTLTPSSSQMHGVVPVMDDSLAESFFHLLHFGVLQNDSAYVNEDLC